MSTSQTDNQNATVDEAETASKAREVLDGASGKVKVTAAVVAALAALGGIAIAVATGKAGRRLVRRVRN